jgi:uncharacterized repeat protein (TIGR02543 family)
MNIKSHLFTVAALFFILLIIPKVSESSTVLKLSDGNEFWYSSIQTAYDEASLEGDEIFIRNLTFAETLYCDQDVSVLIQGGLDEDFKYITGYSTLVGSMEIINGTVEVDNIILKNVSSTGYTVTYSGNGHTSGSVPIDTVLYEQGQTVTVLGNTGSLVRAGYIFEGWNIQADGNGAVYSPGQTFTIGAADVDLYAGWTANLTCMVDSDCASQYYCSVSYTCLVKNQNGSSCNANNQCQSSYCIDGYCCNSACNNQCEACDIDGNLGSCTIVSSGQPHGSRSPCPGSFACQGFCNGMSLTCSFPGLETACDDGDYCTENDRCSGAGFCIGGTPLNCDDGNICTVNSCLSGLGICGLTPVEDGTECGPGLTCQSGECL